MIFVVSVDSLVHIYLFVFLNVNLFHLSFKLPSFVVLINFLLERLYIFF